MTGSIRHLNTLLTSEMSLWLVCAWVKERGIVCVCFCVCVPVYKILFGPLRAVTNLHWPSWYFCLVILVAFSSNAVTYHSDNVRCWSSCVYANAKRHALTVPRSVSDTHTHRETHARTHASTHARMHAYTHTHVCPQAGFVFCHC